jgi:hypothetical protein
MDKKITENSIHNKLWKHYEALERSIRLAQEELDAAEKNMKEFKSAVRKGNTSAEVFGVIVSRWKDERYLPNGDSVIIDQGSDETIQPDSIAADLAHIEETEGEGEAKKIVDGFCEELDDYFCGQDAWRDSADWD